MCLEAVLASSACVRVAKQGRKHVHVRTDGTYEELLTLISIVTERLARRGAERK